MRFVASGGRRSISRYSPVERGPPTLMGRPSAEQRQEQWRLPVGKTQRCANRQQHGVVRSPERPTPQEEVMTDTAAGIPVPADDGAAASSGDERLASLGYRPQLNRVLGLFAN